MTVLRKGPRKRAGMTLVYAVTQMLLSFSFFFLVADLWTGREGQLPRSVKENLSQFPTPCPLTLDSYLPHLYSSSSW